MTDPQAPNTEPDSQTQKTNLLESLKGFINESQSRASTAGLGVYFLFLLFSGIHLLDILAGGIPRGNPVAFTLIWVFFFGALFVITKLLMGGSDSPLGKIIFIGGIISIWFPILISFFTRIPILGEFQILLNILTFLYIWVPPIPVLLLVVWGEEGILYWIKWFYAVIFVIFLFLLLVDTVLPNVNIPLVSADINPERSLTEFWDFTTQTTRGGIDNLLGIGQSINQRLNSSMYYTGVVEKNRDRILGVKLENVEPVEDYYVQGSSPSIRGYITAETFLDDTIGVSPTCVIDQTRRKDTFAEARTEPNPPLEVFTGGDKYFECWFDEEFTPGLYPVEVGATFEFETWADVTYDFVLEDKAREYAQLRQDIYQELDIEKEPTAVYTNGPVMLGMGGASRMPILVQNDAPHTENAYLGFTLQKQWQNGDIKQVQELTLKIPNEFELDNCALAGIGEIQTAKQADENVEGYNSYSFPIPTNTAQPFTSIRCELIINPDSTLMTSLQAGAEKVTRTFILMAQYEFTLKERTQFRVR